MNLHDAVIVGFRYLFQQPEVGPDEFRPALAEDAENIDSVAWLPADEGVIQVIKEQGILGPEK